MKTATRQITSKKNGLLGGRPKMLSSRQIEAMRQMFVGSRASVSDLTKHFEISRATFYRIRRQWENPILKVAIDDFLRAPAHVYQKAETVNHRMVRYDLAFIGILARMMKCRISLVPVRFDRLVKKASHGDVDIAMGWLNNTADRASQVTFSDRYTPREIVRAHFLGHRELKVSLNHPESLIGRCVAVQVGTTHDSYVRMHLSGLLQVKRYHYEYQMFQALVNRDVDLILAHENEFAGFLKEHFQFECKLPGVVYDAFPCLAIAPENQPLLESLNKSLETCHNLGVTGLLHEHVVQGSLDKLRFTTEMNRLFCNSRF